METKTKTHQAKNDGITPIYTEYQIGHQDIVNKTNMKDTTGIYTASKNGCYIFVKKLMEKDETPSDQVFYTTNLHGVSNWSPRHCERVSNCSPRHC